MGMPSTRTVVKGIKRKRVNKGFLSPIAGSKEKEKDFNVELDIKGMQ